MREDEKIGFVFPVYSWAPPVIVQEFIRKLVLKGYQQQYLFFVCSCGDDTGLTRQVMEKALAARGWRCNAGFSVIMPNNYVLFPGFDVDSKELEKKKLAEAVPALEKVSRLITGRETVFACKEGVCLLSRRGSSIRYLFVIRCLPNLSMQRVSASGASAVKKLSGREYNDEGKKTGLGKELHRLPGMLSCVPSACGAIW